MADENSNRNPDPVTPDPNTGDILGAMEAEQANMVALYQLQQVQNQSLESIIALHEFTNEQLKQQTRILNNIYRYLTQALKNDLAASSRTSNNPIGNSTANDVTKQANANASAFLKQAGPYLNILQQALGNSRRGNELLEQYIEEMEERYRYDVQGAEEETRRTQRAATAAQFTETMEGDSNKSLLSGGMDAVGQLAGDAASQGISAAVGPALGAALTPVLGPLGPIVGEIGGKIIGDRIGDTIEKGFEEISELIETIQNLGRKTRDEVLKASFEKIRHDVRDMGTAAIETYNDSVQNIYSTWDKNISQVTATMGYTKEAVNSLQDSVAQRLEKLGFANAINASDYLDELGRTLNANLNGTLAEAFAAQNLILEKAVPELDLSTMAEQFGAIYTRAQQQGLDAEATMIDAMNQVAGAVKAIEQTTDGNNQFIKSVPAYIQQAQEIVARAGGSVDKVASLTTEMMAAEGPLAALAPQLSGFTGELVSILTKQNDSTAVALRAIMHDIDTDIGISATDFMTSFMEDTKGTLVTAFEAIDEFIERNENPAARQEFLEAMESLFGIQSDKLAQLDFGYLGEQLAQTNAQLNKAALLDAEALVVSGETTSLEQQLVNNTSNMLLAQNAVRDTLDNAIMRKLEQNELQMERMVYEAASVQSVELSEANMDFFTGMKDLIVNILDPFGLFRGIANLFSADESEDLNVANYETVMHLSSIESAVADNTAADENTEKMLAQGVAAVQSAMQWSDGNTEALIDAVENYGIGGSLYDMTYRVQSQQDANESLANTLRQMSDTEQAIGNYRNTAEQQQREAEKKAQEAEKERAMTEAQERNRQQAEAEARQTQENHDNLAELTTTQVPQVTVEVQGMREDLGLVTRESTLEVVAAQTVVQNDTLTTISNQMGEQVSAVGSMNDSLGSFTTVYISSISGIRAQLQESQDNSTYQIVQAIGANKPDVSKLTDINEGVDKLITLFSTYLEFIDQSLEASGEEGLRMSPNDREQIMQKGLLY